MKILVTGAAGFIGQKLVNALLAQSHAVTCLDIVGMRLELEGWEEIEYLKTDITDHVAMGLLAAKLDGKIDACIHLAAVASPPIAQRDPERAWATNVRGTHNVLQLLHAIKCRKIVFFSSAHVYGISPRYMPTDERHPLALHDTYTTTKIMGEQLCQLFYENHGISYTTLRLWNAYGLGQSQEYFLGVKIAQARAGKLTIRNEGVTKDWIHVDDVVRAAILAMRSRYVGPVNVGTGIETSLGEIVGVLAREFGVEVARENVPDEGPTRMQCDASRAREILGWESEISFKDGLAGLIRRAKS
jgi:UDP-glucose 4-epimerase